MTRLRETEVEALEGSELAVLYIAHDTPLDFRIYLAGKPADMAAAGRAARFKLWAHPSETEIADVSLTLVPNDLEGGVQNRMQGTLLGADLSAADDSVRWKVQITESGLTIMAGKPRQSAIVAGGPT